MYKYYKTNIDSYYFCIILFLAEPNQKDKKMQFTKEQLEQQLIEAFKFFDKKSIRSLLAAGVDSDKHIRNKLLANEAVIKPADETKLFNLLLEFGADPNLDTKIDHRMHANTLFKHVLTYNYRSLPKAKLLLKKGVNIDAIDEYSGTNAMHDAASNVDDSFDVVKFLRRNGANMNIKDSNGQTPLMQMTDFYRIYDEDLFLDTNWLINPIKYAIKYGADVNAKDNEGRTPLIQSVDHVWDPNFTTDKRDIRRVNFNKMFYYEIPKILLINGADFYAEDKAGYSAMYHLSHTPARQQDLMRAYDDARAILKKAQNQNTIVK